MENIQKTSIYNIIGTIFLAALVFSGCVRDKHELKFTFNRESGTAAPYPDLSFAVISDIHFYDPSLGSSGAAFEETMNSDRKLLLDSPDLLDYAIDSLIASAVNFVLIPGDLTKDGELINHRLVADKLKRLTGAGIPVYVIPGNHDINNPGAVRYEGDRSEPVPSITQADFAQIYGDFGFNSAIARDDDSLSYLVEPVNGLWLLCLDSCRYRENVPGKEEIVSGKISQKTADWISGILSDAISKNKPVMVMIHHGVVEHWKGQSKLLPEFLLTEYGEFGKFLASYNARLVFTGHNHAQDITLAQFNGKSVYDIETGSLVTAPCPIRFSEIKNNSIRIRTETIVDEIHPDTDFAKNARAFVKKTLVLEALRTLKKYRVSGKDADFIADAVGDAFAAHYSGDENPAQRPAFDKQKLGLWGRFIYSQFTYVLDGLWMDLPPADNNADLKL